MRYFLPILLVLFLVSGAWAVEESGDVWHTPVKQGKCLHCHSVHNSANEFILEKPGQDLCLMCHNYIQKGEYLHVPIKQKDCGCHNPHRAENKYNLRDAVNKGELCLKCHKNKAGRLYEHPPVAGGFCVRCHSPHATENKYQLRNNPKDLCLECHGHRKMRNFLKDKKIHPILLKEKGACNSCHDPHGSNIDKNFLRRPMSRNPVNAFSLETYALCFMCHDPQAWEAEYSVNTNFRNGKRSLHFVHVNKRTVSGKNCLSCHNPHGSVQDKLIKPFFDFGRSRMPIEFDRNDDGGGCHVGCHVDRFYNRSEPIKNR